MAQQLLETSQAPESIKLLNINDIEADELKPGLLFPDEDTALHHPKFPFNLSLHLRSL